MLKHLLRRQIASAERELDYDAAYLHEILDASVPAFLKFAVFQGMAAHREGVPASAKFAASLAATIAEDCGPCTQIVVNLALKAGVSREIVSALLRHDLDAAGEDAALGFLYGEAVAKRSEALDALVEAAKARYGQRGIITLAFAAASSRVYPALKRGLGHARECVKVKVGGDEVFVHRAA